MPLKNPPILRVPGFKASAVSCGIKKTGGPDLALILSDNEAEVAGVFTKNSVKAAPVLYCMKRLKRGFSRARGVVVNSGNANACTGKAGLSHAEKTAAVVEKALGAKKGSILVASTGVIGVPLPLEKIVGGSRELCGRLSGNGLTDASRAIMTTDAYPKTSFKTVRINNAKVTIAGIAKGAGMICPDMATMLAFILTDADIDARLLKDALKEAVEASFNSISVDNDMSTNDTVLAFANRVSAIGIEKGSIAFRAFKKALSAVCLDLALMIARDGEGATRLIEITVKGARSRRDAERAARTVAGSYLVKAAFFGGDPNWGRILAALGRSGASFRQERVGIRFNKVQVVRNGIDTGREKKAAAAIKTKDVKVEVDLGGGGSSARVWTSDLTYDYVRINSSYRT